MPVAPCLEPSCPEWAEVRGRCRRHAGERNTELKGRTAGAQLYKSARWRACRRKVLSRDRYTCKVCLRFGNEVDHVVPIADGGSAWDMANLQTLCKSCHTRKTQRETRR